MGHGGVLGVYSIPGLRRSAFVAERLALELNRRRCEPRVGFVALRTGASGASARWMMCANFSWAIWRLRHCDRSSAAVTTSAPATNLEPSLLSSRWRCQSDRTREAP